jgi:L-ribulose-5-phosphate 3-epimerase
MQDRIAGHTNSYHTYGFDEALEGIAAAGYDLVELSAVGGWTEHVRLTDASADVRRKVEAAGLRANALSIHSDLTTDEGVKYGIAGIRWAADYGLDLVTTAIGGHASKEESQEDFFSRVGDLAHAAEEAGVTVALEIHGDIMCTGEATKPLIERIGSPAIRVKYDTGNVEFYGGRRAVDDIHHVLPYLVNLDMKDKVGGKGEWNFPPPGSGTIDFRRLLRILDDAGYTGPMAVEIEFQGEPWPPLEQVTAAMRSAREHLLAAANGAPR